MCRSAALRISPVWTNRTTYRHVIPSENAVSRGIFPSSRFYLAPVLHPTWWIPPLRLRYGRNDIWGTFPVFIENNSVLSRAERHIGRSLRVRCLVTFFNRRVLRTGGTALQNAETTGAKGIIPNLTVGNGLCAVPLRCEYHLCGQTEPPIDMSFRAKTQ